MEVFKLEDYGYAFRSCIDYAVAPVLRAKLHIKPSVELSVVCRVQVFHNRLRVSETGSTLLFLPGSLAPGTDKNHRNDGFF